MKRVATAVVLIPLVIALILLAPDWLFIATLGSVAVIAIREFLALAERLSTPPKTLTTSVIVVLFTAMLVNAGPLKSNDVPREIAGSLLVWFAYFSIFLFLGWCLRAANPSTSVPGAGLAFAGVVYISMPLASLYSIRTMRLGGYFLVLLLILVWCGDIAALYVGRAVGRHKLAPTVSPGKTWEGAIASLVCSAILSLVISVVLLPRLSDSTLRYLQTGDPSSLRITPLPAWWAILVGIFINAAAQLGDLVESVMKRAAGVKDSGSLLPGHGGMLDRIDALLFAAPVGLLLFLATNEYFQQVEVVRPLR